MVEDTFVLSDRLSTPLMTEVRAATAEAHARAEQMLALERLSSLDRYIAFLRATQSVVDDIEPKIRRHLPVALVADLDDPARRLEADLATLGAAPSHPATISRVPVDSEAAALGASYVLIGSQLGGAIIGRTLASVLALTPSNVSYLCPRDPPVGPRWKHFGTYVNGWGQSAPLGERDRMIDAAHQTFAAFHRAFARLPWNQGRALR